MRLEIKRRNMSKERQQIEEEIRLALNRLSLHEDELEELEKRMQIEEGKRSLEAEKIIDLTKKLIEIIDFGKNFHHFSRSNKRKINDLDDHLSENNESVVLGFFDNNLEQF